MSQHRHRYFSPEFKAALLRLHFVERKPAREICKEHGIRLAQFLRWRNTFFKKGVLAFDQTQQKRELRAKQRKIQKLEDQLAEGKMTIKSLREHINNMKYAIRRKKIIAERMRANGWDDGV